MRQDPHYASFQHVLHGGWLEILEHLSVLSSDLEIVYQQIIRSVYVELSGPQEPQHE